MFQTALKVIIESKSDTAFSSLFPLFLNEEVVIVWFMPLGLSHKDSDVLMYKFMYIYPHKPKQTLRKCKTPINKLLHKFPELVTDSEVPGTQTKRPHF